MSYSDICVAGSSSRIFLDGQINPVYFSVWLRKALIKFRQRRGVKVIVRNLYDTNLTAVAYVNTL